MIIAENSGIPINLVNGDPCKYSERHKLRFCPLPEIETISKERRKAIFIRESYTPALSPFRRLGTGQKFKSKFNYIATNFTVNLGFTPVSPSTGLNIATPKLTLVSPPHTHCIKSEHEFSVRNTNRL